VRFITFEILTTGVLAFECALRSRKSSFVQAPTARRAAFFAMHRFSQLHRDQLTSRFDSRKLIPATTARNPFTSISDVNRSAFIDNDSREQFEMRTHDRMIDI
jgi:hypothetical protein